MKMKIKFVLLSLLFGLSGTFSKPNQLQLNGDDDVAYQQRIFEDVIEAVVYLASEFVAQFDPFHIKHKELSLFGHDIQVTNIRFEGFSNFYPTDISLNGILFWDLDLEITLPKITCYIENWQVDGDTIFGNGTARVELENLVLKIFVRIRAIPVAIKEVQFASSVGNVEVLITGLYNDEQLSKEISDKITHFLNNSINKGTYLDEIISDILFAILQYIIQ